MKITKQQVFEYLGMSGESSEKAEAVRYKIATDTRGLSLNEPSLFIALKGPQFDGHRFIDSAIEKGARLCLVTEMPSVTLDEIVYIKVQDTYKAYLDLARGIRSESEIPWVSITGSAGKTSTRSILNSLLCTKGIVLQTQKNLNNTIGVPLTISGLTNEHQFSIVEAGMNQVGEMEAIAKCLQPDICLITNIGPAHVGNFEGDVEFAFENAIANEKAFLLRELKTNGWAVLNADDSFYDYLAIETKASVKSFGIQEGDIRAENILLKPESSCFTVNGIAFTIPLPGVHSIYNCLGALAVCECLGYSLEEFVQPLSSLEGVAGRLQFKLKSPITLIDDTYNASPDSMVAAIKVLQNINGRGRKIAVLGDMKELGGQSKKLHLKCVETLNESPVDHLLCCGEMWGEVSKEYKGLVKHFDSLSDLQYFILDEIESEDVVLVKAGHSMEFYKLVNALNETWENK